MIEKGPFETHGLRYSVTIIHSLTDPNNSETDVVVHFTDKGTEFVGSIFTVECIREHLSGARESNPSQQGLHFATTGLVVVDRLTEDSVPEVVEQMIKEGMFFEVFKFCG